MKQWLLMLSLIVLLGCITAEEELIKTELISETILIGQGNDSLERIFNWSYDEMNYSISMELYENAYEFYTNRSRLRDYDLFASDPYDDEAITIIAQHLTQIGTDRGLSGDELPCLAASFVQSMPYTPDNLTTHYDEYPRFPYETLYDNGGDCEDTAILTAAIIQELGYKVVLISLPDHMAVGVGCSEGSGDYYEYENVNYCYLETTGEGWVIGEVPGEYKNISAQIIPVYKRPYLDISFNTTITKSLLEVKVSVNTTIKNLGSSEAENVKLQFSLQTTDLTTVWDLIESDEISVNPEAIVNYQTVNLKTVVGNDFRVCVKAYGENFLLEGKCGEWVTWG